MAEEIKKTDQSELAEQELDKVAGGGALQPQTVPYVKAAVAAFTSTRTKPNMSSNG